MSAAELAEQVNQQLKVEAEEVDRRLAEVLPTDAGLAQRVCQAMAHSIQGGKRIRPFVVRRAAETFGLDPELVWPTALAFEVFHTATLIHDDLPAIDNSDLRRGRPSCHVAFDEATAVLAGDALLILAFELLASQAKAPQTPPERCLRCVGELAHAAGIKGVIGGEMADIWAERHGGGLEELQYIHLRKTAALFVAAARCGAILADAPAAGLEVISEYAQQLGLLFQITDDLLDVVGDKDELGKPVGADAEAGKLTYPGLLGMEAARQQAQEIADRALALAEKLPRHQQIWAGLVYLVLLRTR